jgi:hypothetical protein
VAYQACTGAKPPFEDRDGAAVWKLLDAVGAARAENAIRVAFSDDFGKRRSIRSVADDPAKFSRVLNGKRGGPMQPTRVDDNFTLEGKVE